MSLLTSVERPLAIAMWDFSWLQRHYKRGSFADWDKVLDELAERGYDAIRIDVFPHLVAPDPLGKLVETFRCVPKKTGAALWGNPWTIRINPRQGLVEFLAKCRERKLFVGLSTWFYTTEDKRNEMIEGADEFVRVWDETLQFLADHNCLEYVIYVDLLNEYPHYHGFKWLLKVLDTMNQPVIAGQKFNDRQKTFYRGFINEVISRLKTKWPQLDFLASQTQNAWEEDIEMDYSRFDLLDVHLWMVHNDDLARNPDYFRSIFDYNLNFGDQSDADWAEVYARMMEKWNAKMPEYERWMDAKMQVMHGVAQKWQIPLGNTEGWGPINWVEHPALGWEWVKQAGEIGARLGAKYGYNFNCTSNFCHPHFEELWEDIEWNRRVTDLIRSGEKRIC